MDRRYPTIVSTSPYNYQTDVPVNVSIRAEFNVDLDARTVANSVFMTTNTGQEVPIRTSYRQKVITITPLAPLEMNMTYQVTFVGDANVTDGTPEGIQSIIGDCLSGNYTITFSTEVDETLAPPEITLPANGSVVKAVPTFKWIDYQTGMGYHVQLSTTKTFATLVYPETQQVITGSELTPNVVLEDGIYYFRIRYIRADGATGQWSEPCQFNLDTLDEGTISTGDAPPVEEEFPLYDGMPIELEIVDSFPKASELLVSTKVKSLYFRVLGDIDISLLDVDSFKLEGRHISGDYQEQSHGIVKGGTTVVQDDDGTTYLVFTPEPIPTEEAGGQ